MGKKITLLLILLLPLLSAAGETLRGNSVLSGVKDDVASCFVADDVMRSSMRTVPLGVKTGKAISLAPFGERGDGLVRSVVVSGSLRKSGPDYVVRIILKDRKGGERLILESYEELTSGCADELTFSGYGEETLLMDGVDADSIVVCVRDAEVRLDEVGYSVEPVSQVGVTAAGNRKRQVESIVERINRYNVANRKLWRAAVTDVSLLDYGTKKRVVGIADGASSLGIEYYGGGIFEMGSHAGMARSRSAGRRLRDAASSPYVDHFDWRDRHGKNWITSVKDQGPSNQCTYFAAAGLAEALTGLYFNQNFQLDLSEQKVHSCSYQPAGYGRGNTLPNVLNCLKNVGICEESNCPRVPDNIAPSCDDLTGYDTLIFISGYQKIKPDTVDGASFSTWFTDEIKYHLIHSGPLLSGYQYFEEEDTNGHAMLMIGYGKINVGDTIRFFDTDYYNSEMIVQEYDNCAGKTYFVFKNSYGVNNMPYVKIFFNRSSNIAGPYAVTLPIRMRRPNGTAIMNAADVVSEDRDGDGYYNWGIGPKPSHCPAGVSDEPDGDDSDPSVGPMDAYGHLQPASADSLDTLFISTRVSYADTIHIYRHVVVTGTGIMDVSAPVTFHGGAKLFIRDGGKVYSSDAMTNVDLRMDSGGYYTLDYDLNMEHRGMVRKAPGKDFVIPPGGQFELYYGKIK